MKKLCVVFGVFALTACGNGTGADLDDVNNTVEQLGRGGKGGGGGDKPCRKDCGFTPEQCESNYNWCISICNGEGAPCSTDCSIFDPNPDCYQECLADCETSCYETLQTCLGN